MAIRRVLLPFVGLGDLENAAHAAFLVGRLHQAQVRALLFERAHLDVPFRGEYVEPDVMRRVVDNARKERDELRGRAAETFHGLAGKYRSVEAEFSVKEGDIGEGTAHEARHSDLSVLGSGAGFANGEGDDLRDAALFRSGRPVLLVPRDGVSEVSFHRIVIAWKESVEAARAVAAAQPFLRTAKQVHLVTVGEGDEAAASLREVELYLQLHYAEVRSEFLARRPGGEVSDILQHKAEVLGGALLVMGAFSRWRWREQLFGGVTDSVLRRARVPIVLAR